MACHCGRNKRSAQKKVNKVSPTMRLNSLLAAGNSITQKKTTKAKGPFRVKTVPKTTVQKIS